MEDPIKRPEKIKLTEINPYLTCYLCKGYLIDATTISECLHSFCRSCIIKFLQDNSYCPVCEVIINKAKPNLKLDKTLQDIVYKLVPELFLREMSRRKQFYQQYPQIAVRVSPEERGDDTERTIFNPQDCISLSMEYVSADSSPGAIKLLGCKNDSDKSDQFLSPEENQALMKRYLQCPGMCRVDVLKKFVINKYNVDTSLFHIDILYKRVPLPDHYTLIDIAYIYSWKRNEPMKFYFRITDLNKVSERFDYFDSANHNDLIVQLPLKTPRQNASANRRKEHVNKKKKKQEVQNDCDKAKVAVVDKDKTSKVHNGISDSSETFVKTECDNNVKEKVVEQKLNSNKENLKVKVEEKPLDESDTSELSPKRFILKIKKDPEKCSKNEENSSSFKVSVTSTVDSKDNKTSVTYSSVVKPEVSGHLKNNVQNQQSDVKNSVYTNITLNRTNNLEIITKIQKVSNKDGKPIEVNIIEQTVKANETPRKQKKKPQSLLKLKPTYLNKTNKGSVTYTSTMINSDTKNKTIDDKVKNKRSLLNNSVKIKSETIQPNTSSLTVDSKFKPSTSVPTEYDEKLKFLENFNLTSKDLVPKKQVKIEPKLSPNKDVNKRKPHSPAKSSSPKRAKLDKKPVTRIILQSKPKPSDKSQTPGLQSLIENCKIPSSLSITIKDSTENNKTANTIPPVKNFIEILKLPDENKPVDSKENSTKLSFSLRMNDDSEQKVDEDLAEIAKSLTEKIPMSTTISQIVGPKADFAIPVKTNAPPKFNVQSQSPVPDLANKLLNVPTDSKLNSRTHQSFQKIFEESIKKPDGSVDTEKEEPIPSESSNEVTSTSNNKRNLMEIASQLYKKTKLELEKTHPLIDSTTPKAAPKVAIPRLPHQRSLLKISKKMTKNSLLERADGVKSQQTLTNMHSNALGLNYTISVGPNVPPKTNGLILKKEGEVKGVNKSVKSVETKPSTFTPSKDNPGSTPRPNSIPRNISPSYNSPRNSPKHSPKSSPMVKHMYAPTANLKMDQLRVNTYSPKLPSNMNNLSKISPNLPSSSTCSKSPNTSIVSPKPVTPSSVSPKPSTASPGSTSGVTSALSVSTPQVKVPSKNSPKPSSSSQTSPLSPNQILERYNIQNLAQLTASLNFNAANFGVTQGNQLAAFQQVMLLKHFEMQNRQNWLNLNNQGSLLQYEKYLQNLQNLKTAQNQVLGNIKEN